MSKAIVNGLAPDKWVSREVKYKSGSQRQVRKSNTSPEVRSKSGSMPDIDRLGRQRLVRETRLDVFRNHASGLPDFPTSGLTLSEIDCSS